MFPNWYYTWCLTALLKSGAPKGHLKEVSRGPRSAAVPYGEADYLICFVLKKRWPLLVCPLIVLPIKAPYVPVLINKKKSVVYIPKTLRESRKAALRISHLLLRCQVVFTKICHYYYCLYCYCRYCHYYWYHKYYCCHCHYRHYHYCHY